MNKCQLPTHNIKHKTVSELRNILLLINNANFAI